MVMAYRGYHIGKPKTFPDRPWTVYQQGMAIRHFAKEFDCYEWIDTQEERQNHG
jgi:hypothetical protein